MYKIKDIRDKLPVNKNRITTGGKIPKRVLSIKRIVVHCSADDDKPGADVFALAKYDVGPNHISLKGCYTFTYHYYVENVDNEVKIYKCVDHSIVTWHVGSWNNTSLGVAVDKTADDKAPEKRQAVIWLVAKLCKELGLKSTDVKFHRELQGTGWYFRKGKKVLRKTCPGLAWDADSFRNDVQTHLTQSWLSRLLNRIRSNMLIKKGTIIYNK